MFALRYFDVFVFLECSEGGLQPFAPTVKSFRPFRLNVTYLLYSTSGRLAPPVDSAGD